MGAITELQKTLQNQNSLIPIETFLMIGKLATAAVSPSTSNFFIPRTISDPGQSQLR